MADFDPNDIQVDIIVEEQKEEITPDGINNIMPWKITIINNSDTSFSWLNVDLVLGYEWRTNHYKDRQINGTTETSKWTVIHKSWRKLMITCKDISAGSVRQYAQNHIPPNNSYDDSLKFLGIKVYQIYGEFLDGQQYKQRRYYEMKFDKDGVYHTTESRHPCFVTTAAFGDPDHPTVRSFRWLRDENLVKSLPGRIFIEWYNKNGPVMAGCIETRPMLRHAARMTLTTMAKAVDLARKSFE